MHNSPIGVPEGTKGPPFAVEVKFAHLWMPLHTASFGTVLSAQAVADFKAVQKLALISAPTVTSVKEFAIS